MSADQNLSTLKLPKIFTINSFIISDLNDAEKILNANKIKTNSQYDYRVSKFNELKSKFELNFDDFELFWYSKPIQTLKDNGVILSL